MLSSLTVSFMMCFDKTFAFVLLVLSLTYASRLSSCFVCFIFTLSLASGKARMRLVGLPDADADEEEDIFDDEDDKASTILFDSVITEPGIHSSHGLTPSGHNLVDPQG